MWIDVRETDWFYDEVMEASRIYLEDGQPFVQGIPYNVFKDGSPYLYEEFVAVKGQTVFELSTKIVPTAENPLFVFVDGVQTVYKSCTVNQYNRTVVELYSAPREGAVVAFASFGEPVVDNFGKPVDVKPYEYPKYVLSKGANYRYFKWGRYFNEYFYAFGRVLRRADVSDEEWNSMTWEEIAKKYIGYRNDIYCVSPQGVVITPFNLCNVTCTLVYAYMDGGVIRTTTEKFKPYAFNVLYTNRFFPNAYMNRVEAFVLIDRLRKLFYSKFTDQDAPSHILDETYIAYEGQNVFRLKGLYPAGEGKLLVKVNGDKQRKDVDYEEYSDSVVLFKYPLKEGDEVHFYYEKTVSRRFYDVGYDREMVVFGTEKTKKIDGDVSTSWWASAVLSMEEEKLNDGEYLISGIEVNNLDQDGRIVVDSMYNPVPGTDSPVLCFLPYTLLTRAQAVTVLNRFRKWCIERFKL